jgi:hypothetical protein
VAFHAQIHAERNRRERRREDGSSGRGAVRRPRPLWKSFPQIMSSAPPHPFSVLTNTTTVPLDRYRDVVLGLKSVLHGVGPENFGWMVGRLGPV